jgi:two-component system phosphate regulon sensor histidine kinase PhoR
MIRRDFIHEASRVIAFGAAGGLLGFLLGRPLAGFTVAIVIYTLWQTLQLARLSQWLGGDTQLDPPESSGIWAVVLDKLHHLQKGQRHERERLQAVANYITEGAASLSDGVIMVDAQGVIVWCNEATERLIGVRCPDDKGNLLVNLLREPDFVQYFLRGEFDSALEIHSPGNLARILRVEITLFGEDSRLVFLSDITRVSRLEKMRVDFIANVSHELRTPLTVINGYLETLRGQEGEVPAHSLQRALTQMQAQSERMQTMVSDITLLSRLESEPERDSGVQQLIDVAALATMLVDDAKCSIGADRHFHMELDSQHLLHGEEKAIHSAFGNLLDNACKYSEAGGNITVRWFVGEQGAVFEVEDDGIGVDAADVPNLSERFYRADKSRSVASGGTGLGLAIVKHALLRHDGGLEIKSRLGAGSVFRCNLPLYRVTAKAA